MSSHKALQDYAKQVLERHQHVTELFGASAPTELHVTEHKDYLRHINETLTLVTSTYVLTGVIAVPLSNPSQQQDPKGDALTARGFVVANVPVAPTDTLAADDIQPQSRDEAFMASTIMTHAKSLGFDPDSDDDFIHTKDT